MIIIIEKSDIRKKRGFLMFKRSSLSLPLSMLFVVLLLTACGSNGNTASNADASAPASSQTAASPSPSPSVSTSGDAEATTRVYADFKGRQVEVPTNPQRIVYVGSNPGDLLAIGVKPLGATLSVIASQVAYPELLDGIEDVGYPYNAEKVLALKPDLILFDDWEEEGLPQLERIAPTVIIGLAGPTPPRERVAAIADLLDKKNEADEWFKAYDAKVEQTKTRLGERDIESAVSLLLLGPDMYIMGNQGLNATLFGELGLKPADGVRKLIDKDERFIDVSNEVLPDYMGSDVFLLTDDTKETGDTQAALLNSALWKTIPAVKAGRVYAIDSKFNYDDPITLDRLLDELVSIVTGAAK